MNIKRGDKVRSVYAMNLRSLKAAAAKIGATVENDSDGRWCVYQVCAPKGYEWSDGGSIHLRVEWPDGSSGEDKDAVIQDAINRIECGLQSAEDDRRAQ